MRLYSEDLNAQNSPFSSLVSEGVYPAAITLLDPNNGKIISNSSIAQGYLVDYSIKQAQQY